MKLRTMMLTAGVMGMAAACTGTPTAAREPSRSPSGPAYDGGGMYGSGNLAEATNPSVRPVPGDSVQLASMQQGGGMYGSGN
jgi:hypothetical protein